jgi:hypothetical protein
LHGKEKMVYNAHPTFKCQSDPMVKKGLNLPEAAEKSRVLAASTLKSVYQYGPLVLGFTWEKDERRDKRF